MRRDRRRPSATAYHEAGHVVGCWAFRSNILFASIVPNPSQAIGGEVRYVPGLPPWELTVIRFAGPAAQRRSHPRSAVRQGARWDHELAEVTAETLFDAMHSRRSFLRRAAAEARMLVDRHWLAVDHVARALMGARIMSGFALVPVIELAEAEWEAAKRFGETRDAYAYAQAQAVAGQGLPPLRRAHIEAASLRAVLAGRTDIAAAVAADLTAAGYAEPAIRALWTSAVARVGSR